MAKKKIRVTLIRGTAGKLKRHKATVRGLGLRRTHHSVILEDTPEVRGMINQVDYLVRAEEVE
jgi:large subunit ribosomal protein L30